MLVCLWALAWAFVPGTALHCPALPWCGVKILAGKLNGVLQRFSVID